MAVCSYFIRGYCKFGNNCRNEHPQDGQKVGPGFGNTWINPRNTKTSGLFSLESMKNDLTPQIDKPLWPLSCYGAAKHEPTLISGIDESPEELRVRALSAQKAANPSEYVAYEANKISVAQQVYANALSNLSAAYAQSTKLSAGTNNSVLSNSPFGASTTTTSAFGTSAPAFGQSSFTPSSTPATGIQAFAQPTSAFGQPQQSTSFGQQPQTTSAFGQLQPTSAFGQPSQPSSFIKPASGAFGNLPNSGTTNAFGGGGGFSAFSGQPSAFGATATTPATASSGTFGQPSFGGAMSAPPQPTTSVFGGVTPAASSSSTVFGAPSAFGALGTTKAQQPTSTFGALSPSSSFGGASFASSAQTSSPFAAPATGTSMLAPPPGPQEMQSAFSSQPLSAFPMASPTPSMSGGSNAPLKASGPPNFVHAPSQYKPGLTPYDLSLPSDYQQQIPAEALEAFQSQKFEWGKVPDWIPPLELR